MSANQETKDQEVLGQVLGPLSDNERLRERVIFYVARSRKIFRIRLPVDLRQITFS